jgi:cytosine/adenosine deaminase-related metal-dependent hydrolase
MATVAERVPPFETPAVRAPQDEGQTMRIISCAHVLTAAGKAAVSDHAIRIEGERIGAIEPTSRAEPLFALPALANAHDHARATRSSSFGTAGKPLEIWLHWLAMLPAVDPYLATAVSLARSALGGAGSVMVHYTRAQGLTDYVTEAKEVARAATDVGVRVGFAPALRDRNPLVYGPSEPILAALPEEARAEIQRRFIRPPLPVKEQLALVDAVAAACWSEAFDVQYGPAAVQWCTPELLEGVAHASANSRRRIHMHLLETRYQRAWADTNFPGGIVRYLDSIGFLSERLTLAHCAWARPDELELLAERRVTISVNTSSNLHLRSGVAPLVEMVKRGCRVALGLDGATLDEDDDALREMRLADLLHAGTGFRVDVDRTTLLNAVLVNGRRSVTNKDEGGMLAAGTPADVLIIDWNKLDADRLRPDLDPLDLLFARSTMRHITELIVGGKTIVRDSKVPGIDLPAMNEELLGRFRHGIAQNGTLAAALPRLERAVRDHFETPCC